MSVSFHPRSHRKRRERHAINKNPHRELHIPRDAYRCIFVFLMGNVSRAEAYNISTYSGNVDISLLIVRVSGIDISVAIQPGINFIL